MDEVEDLAWEYAQISREESLDREIDKLVNLVENFEKKYCPNRLPTDGSVSDKQIPLYNKV